MNAEHTGNGDDITRSRGLYYLLEKRGAVARVSGDLPIFEAKSVI